MGIAALNPSYGLVADGKAHKSALVACARKLLIYANTVVQRGRPWIERPAAL
jgi:transposase